MKSPSPSVETLSDHRCVLGEGATYDTQTGIAWWFDILECRLFECEIATRRVLTHDLPMMASALATIDRDRQLVACETGIALRDVRTNEFRVHWPVAADQPQLRSNDGRVHPSGTFWFSTMGKAAEWAAGAIYALRDGLVTRLFDRLTIPNSICFSADGTVGFYSDTAARTLFRVALNPATGLPASAPTPLLTHDAAAGGLDGATIDIEGLIWIARWGGSRVDAFTMEGEHVRSVAIPARQPSCPVFVGQKLDRLLVTSACEGLDDIADDASGRTFVSNVGAIGRPEARARVGPD